MGAGWEGTLLRLSLNERSSMHSVLAAGVDAPGVSGLDARTHALVGLGALVALDAAPTSYDCAVDAALAAGATPDDIVGVLTAVGPTVGLARLVSAAPRLARSIGFDIDAALEEGEDTAQGAEAD
jgi:alkylhydroperoxidase/carboxymuconolactone decarboxylase family protein YurZ